MTRSLADPDRPGTGWSVHVVTEAPVLDHANYATTERYCNLARAVDAARAMRLSPADPHTFTLELTAVTEDKARIVAESLDPA